MLNNINIIINNIYIWDILSNRAIYQSNNDIIQNISNSNNNKKQFKTGNV